MNDPLVRGRFAPSPSGRMHLGNVFCALISWLSAKSVGGEMILRIEDLDTARCRVEYTEQLLDDLHYLGLEYDEGEGISGPYEPYTQSRRTEYYKEILNKLFKSHQIYPCYCSRDELHAPHAPHASDGRVLYGGGCRHLTEQERALKTRQPAYRLKAAMEDIVFTDGLYGFQRMNVNAEWGDFIVRRSDGMFAYQLAVVADDAAMGITQVVRGRDLLTSVVPQLQLYQLLDKTPPEFYHTPMLLAPDGRRLSKRDRDLDMGALRKQYLCAETIIGRLLYLAGILPKEEPLSAKDAIGLFSWERMIKRDIVIDPNRF